MIESATSHEEVIAQLKEFLNTEKDTAKRQALIEKAVTKYPGLKEELEQLEKATAEKLAVSAEAEASGEAGAEASAEADAEAEAVTADKD